MAGDPTIIKTYDELDEDLADRAWRLYHGAFSQLDARAAIRHLYDEEEVRDILADTRIRKYLAYDELGSGLTGIGVTTNDFAAWRLFSEAFFRARWPEYADRAAVWIIGFIGAGAGLPNRLQIFDKLIAAMQLDIIAADGMAVMDYCAFNVDRLNIPRHAADVQHQVHVGTRVGIACRQEVWVSRFDGVYPC